MTPRILTDEEYIALKKKLHQAHDKLIKSTLQEVEAMREFLAILVIPLLGGAKLDLDNLVLDTTTYIRPNLQVFYSDIVYITTLIDEKSGRKRVIKIAILVEHKSEMPTQLAMRLQGMDYINALMKKNYDKDTDTTIPVIPIVFNQFNKDWKPQPYRSLFPDFSPKLARLIPEFDMLVINLSSLPLDILDSFNKFGLMKASLMAMKNVRNKRFLKRHFEEIFLFLQEHPDKTDLRDQLIAYLLGYSDMSAKDLEELLANIFSPVLKQEIMISGTGFLAVAAREAAANAKAEAQREAQRNTQRLKAAAVAAAQKAQLEIEAAREEVRKTREKAQKEAEKAQKEAEKAQKEALHLKARLTVMRSWHRGISLDVITDIADLSPMEVRQLITAFEKAKNYYRSKPDIDMTELEQISGLAEPEIKAILILLQQP